MIDPTDVVALVLAALFAMRRMEIRGTDPRAFPHVAPEAFEAWQTAALRARNLAINACATKVILNTVWYVVGRNRVPSPWILVAGGFLVFIGWVAAISYTWWLSSAAKGLAERLGIVYGKRLPPGDLDRADRRGP